MNGSVGEQHIVTSFDQDLEAIQARLMRMGGLVEEAVAGSVQALTTRDPELADEIVARDKAIDALDESVKSEAARILALRAPTAIDLRIVLAVIAISNHLERSGDNARNVAKRSRMLATSRSPLDEIGSAIRRQAEMVERLLTDSLNAFVHRDVEQAEDVRQRDAEVDSAYNHIFRSLLTHMMEDPRNITAGMHLHFIAKSLERIGDHATGIAEQTVYLVTGKMPDDDRPRGSTLAGGLMEA